MEKQIKDWINAHRKEIALVAVTAVVTMRFAPRRNVAYVQDQDGSYWVLPIKNS